MTATKYEFMQLVKIAERADKVYEEMGLPRPHRLTLLMDLEHAHTDIPLDLNALLNARDGDFCHDIGGIQRHMDRTTGKLGDCFVPRMALKYSIPSEA